MVTCQVCDERMTMSEIEVNAQIRAGKKLARDEMREYHKKLIERYGSIPVWAGPFHYCRLCRVRHPHLCPEHKY